VEELVASLFEGLAIGLLPGLLPGTLIVLETFVGLVVLGAFDDVTFGLTPELVFTAVLFGKFFSFVEILSFGFFGERNLVVCLFSGLSSSSSSS
jgi:hypothetical protein